MPKLVVIRAAFDDEAGVWYVASSDMPGVHAEGATLQELVGKLPLIIEDLLECAGEVPPFDIPVEVIAHASTRVLLTA